MGLDFMTQSVKRHLFGVTSAMVQPQQACMFQGSEHLKNEWSSGDAWFFE